MHPIHHPFSTPFNKLLALYFYEVLLTCRQEVLLIWSRRNVGAVVRIIYGMMHACTALYLLMGLFTPGNPSCEVCSLDDTAWCCA